MNRKTKLFVLVAVAFFMFPYTKEVKKFKSTDVTWAILHQPQTVNRFSFGDFSLEAEHQFNEKIEELNGKFIHIEGFIGREEHLDPPLLLLSENVTGVCAACNHDEHGSLIVLDNKSGTFAQIPNDALVRVSGIFSYDTTRHFQFHIADAVPDSILILNNSNR